MKRDMDLCRKILLDIEETHKGRPGTLEMEGVERDILVYHCRLLAGAGFLELGSVTVRGPIIRGISWAGYEFLDKSRDQGQWERAKDVVKEKTGGLSLELLSAVLSELLKKALFG